jgi:peroxiredoxin
MPAERGHLLFAGVVASSIPADLGYVASSCRATSESFAIWEMAQMTVQRRANSVDTLDATMEGRKAACWKVGGLLAFWLCTPPGLLAADAFDSLFKPRELSAFEKEIKPLAERVRRIIEIDLFSPTNSRARITNELAAILEAGERHKATSPEIVAEAFYELAWAYAKAWNDVDGAVALLKKVKQDFPGTSFAKKAESAIEIIPQLIAGVKTAETLKRGTKFPDFEVTDMDNKPLALKNYRGKVVLITCWVASGACWHFDKLKALHTQYQPQGFEIIGINMDQDVKAARDSARTNNLAWKHYVNPRGPYNELALKYGVGSLCDSFLLDGQGRIVLENFIGMDDVEKAIVKALTEPPKDVKQVD